MNKFSLISYMVLLVAVIFMLNKFVGLKDDLEEKVLGSYYDQMEMINEETGMEVYNLEKKTLSREDLEILNEIY